eukprot:6417631-Pyramimonas_sp.AAC.1
MRGGNGGISQLAFSRGSSSGGNLDRRSYVDVGNREVQDAVMHYLDVCFVNVLHATTQLQKDWTAFLLQLGGHL